MEEVKKETENERERRMRKSVMQCEKQSNHSLVCRKRMRQGRDQVIPATVNIAPSFSREGQHFMMKRKERRGKRKREGEVNTHFVSVVSPGTEFHKTGLNVKGKILDIDLAVGLEHCRWIPNYSSI